MSESDKDETFLDAMLSSRRALASHIGSFIGPIETVNAIVRGDVSSIAMYAFLTVVCWIEAASFYKADLKALRPLQYGAAIAFFGLYVYSLVFRWNEYLRGDF